MAEILLPVFALVLYVTVTATAVYYGTLKALQDFFGSRGTNVGDTPFED